MAVKITCYISYSHLDGTAYAKLLERHLQAYDVRTLISDAEISPGSRWSKVLEDFANADVLILVGSPEALASRWVLDEVEFFLLRERRILPIAFGYSINWDAIPLLLREIQFLQDKSALSRGPSDNALRELRRFLELVRSEDRRAPRNRGALDHGEESVR